MVKRCIGIDIGCSYLRAVQIVRTGDELCIEKVFTAQTRRSKDSPPEILRSLISKYGFDRRADIAISMPHEAVFFRNLETDFAGLEQIRRLISPDPKHNKTRLEQLPSCSKSQNETGTQSTLEYNFPIQPDEIVAQACSYRQLPGKKYSVLTAAVTRASLRERINVLDGAKMHPNIVEAAIFAIHSTVVVNHPEIVAGQAIIAYIDESYLTLAVTQDNNILIVRNIPIVSPSDSNLDSTQQHVAELLTREAELTWRKAFGGKIDQDSKIYLATGGSVSNDLEAAVKENLHCQTVIVEPYARVKCSPEHNGDAAIAIAEGLALRVLAPKETTGINFLEADNAKIKPAPDLKKEFTIHATLVAAIAAILLVGLFARLSHLETKYAGLKNEIRKTFQQTLPQEKNIVNPLVQLDQKLQSLQKDYKLFGSASGAALGPLEILHAITIGVPSEVNINNMLITTESVRLTGTSPSFDSVYNCRRLLQEALQFSTVDVQTVQKEPNTELIHFTISISLDTPE